MATNKNADDYANERIGIFFPGYPNSLTGQCVSLNKWFLAEMTNVPSPHAARGNAKDYGQALVNQGHADEVPAGARMRGDFVVWKQDGGGYGHIGVLLSGDRIFEENVGIAGSKKGVFEGTTVYASRIDPLNTNWRKGAPTYYRIKTYVENIQKAINDMIIGTGDNWRWRFNRFHHQLVGNWDMGDDTWNAIKGQDAWRVLEGWSDHSNANQLIADQELGELARKDNWQKQIYDLQAAINGRPTPEAYAEAQRLAAELKASYEAAQKSADEAKATAAAAAAEAQKLRDEQAANEAASKNVLQIIGNFIRTYFSKEK